MRMKSAVRVSVLLAGGVIAACAHNPLTGKQAEVASSSVIDADAMPAGYRLEPVVYRLILAWPIRASAQPESNAGPPSPEPEFSGLYDRGRWLVTRREQSVTSDSSAMASRPEGAAERLLEVAVSEIPTVHKRDAAPEGAVNPTPRYSGGQDDMSSTNELLVEFQAASAAVQATAKYKEMVTAGRADAYLRQEMLAFAKRKHASNVIQGEKLPSTLHGLELPKVLAILAGLQRVDDDGAIRDSKEFHDKIRPLADSIMGQDAESLQQLTVLTIRLALEILTGEKVPGGSPGDGGGSRKQPGGSGGARSGGTNPMAGEGRPDVRPPNGASGDATGAHETAVNLVITPDDTPIVDRNHEAGGVPASPGSGYGLGVITDPDGSHHYRPGEYATRWGDGAPSGPGSNEGTGPGNNAPGGGSTDGSGDDPDPNSKPKKDEDDPEETEAPPPAEKPEEEPEAEERDNPMSDTLTYLAQIEYVLDSLLGGGRIRQQEKDLEAKAGGDVTNAGDGSDTGDDLGLWPSKVVTDGQGRPILVLQTLAERHAWRLINDAVEQGSGGHADGVRAAQPHWADISLLYLDYIELQVSGGVSYPPETGERRSAAPERPPQELAPAIAPPQPKARLVVITRVVS